MLSTSLKVFAKLNLNLYVTGIKDGYHNLDSFMTSVDIFDRISVNVRQDDKINVEGTDFVPLVKNSAYLAGTRFLQHYKTTGCDIEIVKGIPQASGLGGSSADAVGVLVALAKLNGINTESADFLQVCAQVGSDVVFMAKGGLARLTDRGTKLQYFDYTPDMYFVITTFTTPMNTAEVFAWWDKCRIVSPYIGNVLTEIISKNQQIDGTLLHNDLEDAVKFNCDYANKYLAFCNSLGVNTTMTGSGSAYFVLCQSQTDAVALCEKLNANGFASRVSQRKFSGVEFD